MWWLRRWSADPRNVLFDAALEFGQNWRRDISEFADERLRDLGEHEQVALAKEVEAARNAIEDWILSRWEASSGNWSKSDAQASREFVRTSYPWMDKRNAAHAISQGTYYAWHG